MQNQPLSRLGQLSFTPGANQRGRVSGAAWSYVLPSQELASVVCLGNPSAAAVSRLCLLADCVQILPPAGSTHLWQRTVAQQAWPNVAVGRAGEVSVSQPPDLVWLVGSRRHLQSTEATRWRQLLRQAKLVYRERSSAPRLPHASASRQSASVSLDLHLTPLLGEPRSAVPAGDEATSRHFRAAGLEEDWLSRELRRRGIPFVSAATRRLGLGPLSSRLFTRRGLISGGDLPDVHTPPRYLRAAAAAHGVKLEDHRWGLSAKGQYASQKALFFLYPGADVRPSLVVKISQDPSRSHLLENAYAGMRLLEATEFGAAGRLPRARFAGSTRGLQLVGEEAVAGTAFVRRSKGGSECPYAADAVAALIELGRIGAGQCPTAKVAQTLAGFLDQFLRLYRPSADTSGHLQQQIEALSAAELPIPLVFMHGDPGLQNLVIRPDDRLALLDWENAEQAGMPLWDLFHFLRTYVVWAGRRGMLTSRSAAITEHYLEGASLTDFLVGSVERYRRALQLDGSLIGPLFWTHLLVQALREAPRLDPSELQQGHQLKLLELLVAGRHSAVLRRILHVES